MNSVFFSDHTFVTHLFSIFQEDARHMQGTDAAGLLEIERLKNCSQVCELWRKYALELSLEVKVQGTRFIPIADYTPRLYAVEYERFDLLPFIDRLEHGFTLKMAKMKLSALHRYEIDGHYKVDQITFNPAVDHVTHHHYLAQWLYQSLHLFFYHFPVDETWNASCRDKALRAVNDFRENSFYCTTCSESFRECKLGEVQKVFGNKAIMCVDSASQVCGNTHWVNFLIYGNQIALANRGKNSDDLPGACIYSLSEVDPSMPMNQLIDFFQYVEPDVHLKLSHQRSGSCSRTSFEGDFLSLIFFILEEEHALHGLKDNKTIYRVFNAWRQADHSQGLYEIMHEDLSINYDPHLLVRVLAAFNGSPEEVETFYDFLRDTKQVDWDLINKTEDTAGKVPVNYIPLEDFPKKERLFARELIAAYRNQALKEIWRACHSLFAKRAAPKVNASIDEIRAFFLDLNNAPLFDRCRTLTLAGSELKELPQEEMRILRKVDKLNLSYNAFSHFPKWEFSNLKWLNMDVNLIESFEGFQNDSIEHLSANGNTISVVSDLVFLNLKILSLKRNGLSDFSNMNLPNLIILNLRSNEIEKIENCFFPKLKKLSLDENLLTEIPDSIRNLSELEILSLSENDISEVNGLNFPNLSWWDLSANQLTAVPDLKLRNLKYWDLGSNRLRSVPNFTGLENLIELNLSLNEIQSVPDFKDLARLRSLSLSCNRLREKPVFTRLHPTMTIDLTSNPFKR